MRLKYIDKLKGFAIILVVMGHITEKSIGITDCPFNYFYGSFHMPLFMYLSGLFAMKTFCEYTSVEILQFIKKKVYRIILPFIVVGGLYSLICYSDFRVFFPGKGGYWFLPALFYCMIVEMVIGWAVFHSKKNVVCDVSIHFIVYVALCSLYYGLKPDIPYYLNFIKMYPFFWFGVACTKYSRIFNLISQNQLIITSSCILYLCCISFLHDFPIPITGFFAIVICLNMFNVCDAQIPGILAKVGRSSLAIYVFHWFMLPSQLPIGDVLLTNVGPWEELFNGNFILIICVSLILALPILFACIIIERILIHSKWLGYLIFGNQNK